MRTISKLQHFFVAVVYRGGVKDTRLEAKAKDTKKSEAKAKAKDSLFETEPLEAKDRNARGKAKEQGHRRKRSQKKRSSKIFFRRSPIHWHT